MDDVWCCTDPHMFDRVSTMGPDLDCAKVEVAIPIPPSINEDGPSAFTQGSFSVHHRFAQLVTFSPPIEGIDFEFDLNIEFSSGPSDGAHCRIVLYVNPTIWHHLMMKDLHPEYLR